MKKNTVILALLIVVGGLGVSCIHGFWGEDKLKKVGHAISSAAKSVKDVAVSAEHAVVDEVTQKDAREEAAFNAARAADRNAIKAQEAKGKKFCNGKESFCNRSYGNIAQLMVHDANATTKGLTEGSVKIAGHEFNLPNPVADEDRLLSEQLEDGMRSFKLPIHPVNGRIWAVHTLGSRDIDDAINDIVKKLPSGLPKSKVVEAIRGALHNDLWKIDFSNRPLMDVLTTFKKFLDNNKHEVVTLLLNYFDLSTKELHQKVADDFKAAGLAEYMHVQDVNKPWPTLQEMIDSGKRFVLFVDEAMLPELKNSGYHDYHDFWYQSEYNFHNINELNNDTCAEAVKNRAKFESRFGRAPAASLGMQFQHFITPAIAGSEPESEKANKFDVIMGRINKCAKALARDGKEVYPTFIMVDFYDKSFNDLRRAVDAVNLIKAKQ